MTTVSIQRKIAHLLPGQQMTLQELLRQALLLQLQETNKKIALFEGKYNKEFPGFRKDWAKTKRGKRFSYDIESDYLDWEALDEYKKELMQAVHSL